MELYGPVWSSMALVLVSMALVLVSRVLHGPGTGLLVASWHWYRLPGSVLALVPAPWYRTRTRTGSLVPYPDPYWLLVVP